jgi:hypothetical protein
MRLKQYAGIALAAAVLGLASGSLRAGELDPAAPVQAYLHAIAAFGQSDLSP